MRFVSSPAARERAISVLPHPGSPSTRRGLPIRTARYTAIPIDRSAMYCCPRKRSKTASTPSRDPFIATIFSCASKERPSPYSTFGRIGAPFSRRLSIRESVARSALILAGGASERFGRSKALIEMSGRPLIAHVADALVPLVDETIVSVANADMEASIRAILPRGVFVHDTRPGRGPIEGFLQGFRAARGEVVLVAPCDAPLLRTRLYTLLLRVLDDYDAAIPKLNVLDPVRAVYRRSATLRVLASSPDVPSPSALVDRLRVVGLGPNQVRTADPDLASFLDVNTQGDLDEALKRTRSTKGRRRRA